LRQILWPVILIEVVFSCDGPQGLPSDTATVCGRSAYIVKGAATMSRHTSLLQVGKASTKATTTDPGLIWDPPVPDADAVIEEALKTVEAFGFPDEVKDEVQDEVKEPISRKRSEHSLKEPALVRDLFEEIDHHRHHVEDNVTSRNISDPGSPRKCTPICKWHCSSPICDQECQPRCKPPKCETRCGTVELAGCEVHCQQPECCTVCPKHRCAESSCPDCVTKCSQPLCKLRCPQRQNCTSICESPECEWNCAKPVGCPKPDCKLECAEPPKECKKSFRQKLPSLKKGEIKVSSFVPPIDSPSLLQISPGHARPAGERQHEALRLLVRVESMSSETSELLREIVELPLAP
jgi:hypothetical protein